MPSFDVVSEMDLHEVRNAVDQAARELSTRFDFRGIEARIELEVTNRYPALDTEPTEDVVRFVKSLAAQNATMKVAFGTEGGLFSETLGLPTVVCGPGSMDQGHKPDEFLSVDQLQRCDAMLDRLLGALQDGL